jgi:carboxymethylenebutenolidase
MSMRWDTVLTGDGEMRCCVELAPASAATAGVVVCMHAPGLETFIQDIVHRLAQAGFAAVAPDLYHRDPQAEDDPLTRMGRLRDDLLLQDLRAATAHVRGLAEVDPKRVGTIGFCMGGRISYLHACDDERLRACVVFYGGNLFVPWAEGPSPFERSAGIACPILGLFGAEDTNPSVDDVAKLDAELTRLDKPHEFHPYPGAGHAFLNFTRPSYRPEAAADAWARCLGFLRHHLG